jgi:dihydroxyacetone kinase-like protein
MIKSYKNWINNSYFQIKENYIEINNLDQKLGDGDHGSTILKGLDTAVANLNIISSEDLIFFMSEISKLMRISMGGASGILMTIFIKEVGNINYDNFRLSILDVFSNTIEKIKKRGKVQFGDKSILDIYVPVYDELFANDIINITKILNVLDHALESTKSMRAKVGRAKFLDTKGIGITDPGAFSTTLILKEFFKEFVNEKNN